MSGQTMAVAGVLMAVLTVQAQEPVAELELYAGGKTGALSLTFDDGLASHWTTAAPLMTARGLRGTFFVITDLVDWEGARSAALSGHEIASHSTTNAKLVTADNPPVLVADAAAKLEQSRAAIELEIGEVIAGYRVQSFAYPYGITSKESDGSNLPDLVSQYYAYSRTAGGAPEHNTADPAQWAYRWDGAWRFGYQEGPRTDLAYHWISRSLNLSGTAGEVATIEGNLDQWAIGANRWAVYLYHSDGGATDFALHLDAIEARADSLWIAPFGEVARYIEQRANATLSVVSHGMETVTLALTSGLEGVEPVPLTVSLTWAAAADGIIRVTQGGEPLAYQREGDTLQFAAIADGGEIIVQRSEPEPLIAPVARITLMGDGLEIGFNSTMAAQYTLEHSADLSTPFAAVEGVAPIVSTGEGEAHRFELAGEPTGEAAFYRIGVSAAP